MSLQRSVMLRAVFALVVAIVCLQDSTHGQQVSNQTGSPAAVQAGNREASDPANWIARFSLALTRFRDHEPSVALKHFEMLAEGIDRACPGALKADNPNQYRHSASPRSECDPVRKPLNRVMVQYTDRARQPLGWKRRIGLPTPGILVRAASISRLSASLSSSSSRAWISTSSAGASRVSSSRVGSSCSTGRRNQEYRRCPADSQESHESTTDAPTISRVARRDAAP